jgi:Domain of Unknown Function (DUF1206)
MGPCRARGSFHCPVNPRRPVVETARKRKRHHQDRSQARTAEICTAILRLPLIDLGERSRRYIRPYSRRRGNGASGGRSVDGVLRSSAQTPVGPWLLVLVALGMIAFGILSFFEAKWHRTLGGVPRLTWPEPEVIGSGDGSCSPCLFPPGCYRG